MSDVEIVEQVGTGLFRTVFQFEVLSQERLGTCTLEQLDYLTQEGNCSGTFGETTEQEVSRETMRDLLERQGSDPSFLLCECEKPQWDQEEGVPRCRECYGR